MPECANNVDYTDVIRQNILFRDIDDHILRAISKVLKPQTIMPDVRIYNQGDEAIGLYLIVDGVVEIYIERDTKTYVLSNAMKNHLIGEFPLVGDSTRIASAVTLEKTQLLYLSKNDFASLRGEYPEQISLIGARITNRLCWNRITLALRLSKVFLNLKDEIARALIRELEIISIPANTFLCKQGDHSNELYIIVGGRFEVSKINEDNVREIQTVVGRGDTVGEIGVICETPRVADVLAVRDSSVAKLTRAAFQQLLVKYPVEINQSFVKSIVSHLSGVKVQHTTSSETFALVALSPSISITEIANDLAKALNYFGPAFILDSAICDMAFSAVGAAQTDFADDSNKILLQWLSEQEISHRYVIYITDNQLSHWTQRCLRQADHIMFVADARDSSKVSSLETKILQEAGTKHTKTTIILMQNQSVQVPSRASFWLGLRNVDMHHHVRYNNPADYSRVARFLTGNAVGLVLGGGGARGFAHIGVIRALDEIGIPIDLVGGNSMGALIGAQCALQWSHQEMINKTHKLCVAGDEFTLPIISLFSGKKISKSLNTMFADVHIEDLWRHFYTISCNISRATVMVHDQGMLYDAVLNSNTPPGLFPPQIRDGDLLVDGALLNNVPVDVMKKYNDNGVIIAVDVNAREDLLNNTDCNGGISGWQVLFNRLNPISQKISMPNMIEILTRASIIGGLAQRKKMMSGIADVYLQPPVSEFSLTGYGHAERIVEIGYQYALEHMEQWWQTKTSNNGG